MAFDNIDNASGVNSPSGPAATDQQTQVTPSQDQAPQFQNPPSAATTAAGPQTSQQTQSTQQQPTLSNPSAQADPNADHPAVQKASLLRSVADPGGRPALCGTD
jgi:hypothetical protein